MREKHLAQRIETCLSLAKLSSCPRRQYGALIVDPVSNVIISEGYNGGLRGGSTLCGKDSCSRTTKGIPSGERVEIGCVHAEQNAIFNAARLGRSVLGSWLIVNGEPCLICAKAIKQTGIARVICIDGGYTSKAGLDLLRDNNVIVNEISSDEDLTTVLADQVALKPAPVKTITHSCFGG